MLSERLDITGEDEECSQDDAENIFLKVREKGYFQEHSLPRGSGVLNSGLASPVPPPASGQVRGSRVWGDLSFQSCWLIRRIEKKQPAS